MEGQGDWLEDSGQSSLRGLTQICLHMESDISVHLGLVSKHLEGCGSRVREEPEVRQQGWASREAPHRRRGLGTIALSPVLRIPEPSPVTSTISV